MSKELALALAVEQNTVEKVSIAPVLDYMQCMQCKTHKCISFRTQLLMFVEGHICMYIYIYTYCGFMNHDEHAKNLTTHGQALTVDCYCRAETSRQTWAWLWAATTWSTRTPASRPRSTPTESSLCFTARRFAPTWQWSCLDRLEAVFPRVYMLVCMPGVYAHIDTCVW